MYRVWNVVERYSMLLIAGASIALLWANVAPDGCHRFPEHPLLLDDVIGFAHHHWETAAGAEFASHSEKVPTVHYIVNDILMAFFFAIAAKEVWEAVVLRNGSPRGKKAAAPLFATPGGMIGPIAVHLGLAALLGSDAYDAVARGSAIPTATDIAFSYLVGRIVFGAGHPAVRLLLLLAIADDAAGLIILAIFHPEGDLAPVWLLLSLFAAVGLFVLADWLPRQMDRGDRARPGPTWVRNTPSFWPYLIAGALSWLGFARAGLHPALGLLPIVPTLPHAARACGILPGAERHLADLLERCARPLRTPVEAILFFVGLFGAGVAFSTIGAPTWLVLAGLLIGKPLGALAFGHLGAHTFKLELPKGMRAADLFVIGCVAAIGFTASLFIAAAALPPGGVQSAAEMGALLSFAAAAISVVAGRLMPVGRQEFAPAPAPA